MRKNLGWRSLALFSMLSLSLLASGCGKIESSVADEVPNGMLSESAPNLSKRPYGLACDFLRLINEGKFDKAYNYFGSEVRADISKDVFISRMQSYMQTASTKQSFASRRVMSERVIKKTSYVLVGDTKSQNSKQWVWEFEDSYEGWKIRSLDLPPVAIHKERYAY